MARKKRLRRILLFLGILLLILITRPVGFLLYNYYQDHKLQRSARAGFTNDASNLNETRIDSVVNVAPGIEEATIQISQLIKQARQQGKKISIAGAQHSHGRAHDLSKWYRVKHEAL